MGEKIICCKLECLILSSFNCHILSKCNNSEIYLMISERCNSFLYYKYIYIYVYIYIYICIYTYIYLYITTEKIHTLMGKSQLHADWYCFCWHHFIEADMHPFSSHADLQETFSLVGSINETNIIFSTSSYSPCKEYCI